MVKQKRKVKVKPPDMSSEELSRDLFTFKDLSTHNDPRFVPKIFCAHASPQATGAAEFSKIAHTLREQNAMLKKAQQPGDARSGKAASVASGSSAALRQVRTPGKLRMSKAERKQRKKQASRQNATVRSEAGVAEDAKPKDATSKPKAKRVKKT
mmetsp:Transcript_62336/g.146953  ORF Transcript_62336/g.146953 Transcript_62336/m.146953 type:complete len:154 (-) Transcript_62336:2-463(-)